MKKIIILMIVTIVLAACGGKKEEGEFPNKPITLICPWPAGGVVDLMGRNIATVSSKMNDQPTIVVNKIGGGGVVAFTNFLQEKTDGYNLQIAALTAFSLKPQLLDVQYQIEDYDPIIGMQKVELILFTNPDRSGLNSWEDVITRGKEGKLIVGNSGTGDMGELVQRAMLNTHGVDFDNVVFDGTIGIVNALVGGQIEFGVAFKGQMTEDHIVNGTIKPIATLSANGIENYAGIDYIPTVNELGFDFMKTGIQSQYFIAARKGTPQDIQDKVFEDINEVYGNSEFEQLRSNLGYEMSPLNKEEILEAIQNEYTTVQTMMKIIENFQNK